jgi:hypothetical protein
MLTRLSRWTLVANIVGTRSADRKLHLLICFIATLGADTSPECAKRWQQSLDPDLDHSEWSDLEVSSQPFRSVQQPTYTM